MIDLIPYIIVKDSCFVKSRGKIVYLFERIRFPEDKVIHRWYGVIDSSEYCNRWKPFMHREILGEEFEEAMDQKLKMIEMFESDKEGCIEKIKQRYKEFKSLL